jgi:NAD(P)-dependent dehydrogenase (short-subunit alcohol dehydrogenase family)
MAKILVTGSSKGFGKLIVASLQKDGHSVAATMRDVSGKNKDVAAALTKLGAKAVELDVTDERSVASGVSQALEVLGGIDVVINNAGVGCIGHQESFTTDDWRKVFDVNVFGVQRVNRAVIPHLREKKSGLLVHVSSILGRMVVPFYGPYNASKFALEALADNYRVELSAFGIESVVVEPGGYGTTFIDGLVRPSDPARAKGYGPAADAPEMFLKAFEKNFEGPNAPNPQWVADAVAGLVKMPRGQRPFRTAVDRLGMGDAVTPYNKFAEEMQAKVYSAFGMADVLKVKI